ncbi:MAG: hypothetical protein WAN65_10100 [Candidatus Sulfotelmatobacter sp.]
MSDLSLFDVDEQLHELLSAWQEAPTDQMPETEIAIREYVGEVIRSVDPVRRYIRFCVSAEVEAKEEAERQRARAHMWAARRDRLKAFVFEFMQQWGWKEGKPRKFESATGSLSLRGNGGLQPLTVYDASLVPDEMQDMHVTMTFAQFIELRRTVWQKYQEGIKVDGPHPSNERIRAALAKPCPACKGTGDADLTAYGGKNEPCPECNGTKTASVPGARLEPRGESLVVK